MCIRDSAKSEDARNKRDKICLYIAQHRMTEMCIRDRSSVIALAAPTSPLPMPQIAMAAPTSPLPMPQAHLA